MTFEEILDQAIAMLQRRGRLTYRTLKLQFHLDDEHLEALKDELIYGQRLAVDEDDRVIVWTGDPGTAPSAAAPPVSPQGQAPLTYTPPYLAEKILTSRSALEGERKQVTVLFADRKGSMELLAERDPAEARQLLAPVLERMMAAVHRFEGTVNQVLGDGIMALFGAPVAHEDHAVRACYAALAMQTALRRYAEEVRRSHGLEMQVRVGLNSGEVVVRAISNDLHIDYAAVGQTTHLAARMEQLATPGSIRLTAATLRLAEGLVQVHALGPVPVRGLTEPVEVFELVGASATRQRLQASAARGLTRFVGRQQALEQAGTGHGQVVAAVGEAGVGKSRLVYEFVHSHHTQSWRVLESASVSYGKATPYFPVIDLLKRYSHVEEHDDTRTIRAKVTGQVLTLDPALQDTIPALLSLLDVLPEDSPFLQRDPPQRRQRLLDALKHVLLRESQVQPLVLVFEDLHWIDTETQALLGRLVDSLPTARILLLVNYRPEYQHGWGSKTYYTQLRLDPLPPMSADALLQALLGDDASLAPLTQLLITRTQGNPFFWEESVRTLVETGVLVGQPGAYRLAQALPSIQVPATVQAVLAARIDRLPPEDKRLLQEQRRTLHGQIVAVLETLASDRGDEQVDHLAQHAIRGQVWDKALLYCRQAGEKAMARSAHREAVGYFEQALRALPHLPETRGSHEQAIDLRLALRTALSPSGNFERVLAYLHEAEALAVALDDSYRLGQVLLFLSQLVALRGAYDQAIVAVQRALALATASGEGALSAMANAALGGAVHARGDYRRAIDYYEQAVMFFDKARRRERFGYVIPPAVTSRTWFVWSHAELGMFSEGRPFGEEGLRIAEAVDHPGTLMVASWGAGLLSRRQGDLSRALPLLERAVSISHDPNLSVWFTRMTPALGAAYTLGGRVGDAVPLLTEAMQQSAATKRANDEALCSLSLGEAQVLAGRLEEAHALAERALALACEHQQRGHQAYALRLLGDITARREPPEVEQAATYYHQALTLAEELGMRPLQAHCHRGLGTLYAAASQPEQARTELSTAIEMYQSMDMTFWLPQTEAALAQVEGQ